MMKTSRSLRLSLSSSCHCSSVSSGVRQQRGEPAPENRIVRNLDHALIDDLFRQDRVILEVEVGDRLVRNRPVADSLFDELHEGREEIRHDAVDIQA
ncbi:MAG: hypothetical protein HYY47_01655 [Deltaproteobacteria bacterium]|nr:hypothetical protein [Deltaproteobacteria bacterium]